MLRYFSAIICQISRIPACASCGHFYDVPISHTLCFRLFEMDRKRVASSFKSLLQSKSQRGQKMKVNSLLLVFL
ncbi:hypothetical protein Syun_010170 [Stephania yunnanensis]|uniref:Uncharacterized protein n=1 Tax=Stephania yunnanensis TaxID=152371 RepID=A0AAP0KFY8_9MAGN